MARALSDMDEQEFEELVGRAVDRRMQAWLGQLMDALWESDDEDHAELRPEFAASLRRSLEQAQAGAGVGLRVFRDQLGR